MTKYGKRASLVFGASALAIAVAFGPTPSQAFDTVNWSWDATIDETVTKTVGIAIDLTPSGLVMLEDLQLHIGNVSATSIVTDVSNNQPTEGGPVNGEFVIDLGIMQFTGEYVPENGLDSGDVSGDVFLSNPDIEGSLFQQGTVNTGEPHGITMNFGLGTITVEVDDLAASGLFDAQTELPEVVSVATAVANNSNVDSDVHVQMHEGQFAWGGGTLDGSSTDEMANSHTQLLYEALSAIGNGSIQQGEVSAISEVSNILNATVDSAATAVTNNKSITVDAATAADASVIADVTQFGYMDVASTSNVAGVSINNYTNLGEIDRAIVNSVATSVGNNLSINVSSPGVNGD